MQHTGILTDGAIHKAIESGDIEIDPFNPEHVNVTSVDLTLGKHVSVYKGWVSEHELPAFHPRPVHRIKTHDGRQLVIGRRGPPEDRPQTQGWVTNPQDILDCKKPLETLDFEIDPEVGWVLKPGIGYLMHTVERIKTLKYNPILDGKSSIGRLFLQIHATAGYGDPGFDGQYTLEVIVQHPIRVYPGMRICQIRFQTLFTDDPEVIGPLRTYDQIGKYTHDQARGAVASQAWRQFKK